jgi:hypothetical protein
MSNPKQLTADQKKELEKQIKEKQKLIKSAKTVTK